jgi:DNA-binding NarL/FixJ family response regulator
MSNSPFETDLPIGCDRSSMSETSLTTVVLGRFDDLLARGLRGVIEDDRNLELLAEDIAAAQLETVLSTHRPRVAIIEVDALRTPVEVRELTTRHPATHLLLLADRPSSIESAQLVSFGASACLAKSTQTRDVRNAIHLASRGLQLTPRDTSGAGGSGLLTAREL